MDAEESVALVAAVLGGGDGGDERAVERLVAVLRPVIQARAARTLLCCSAGRDVRQEVADLTQGVFLSLYKNGWRVLRRWEPGRGLSLENFVGLVAKRYVISVLRGRNNPWKDELVDPADLDLHDDDPDALRRLTAREQQELLFARLREELSPKGWQMFHLLFVQELSVPEVMAATGLSPDAVYAWSSRLGRLLDKLKRELSDPSSPRRIPPEDDEE